MKRGTISKRLGIPTSRILTREIIRKKISILEKGLERNRYKGKLREYAVYYKNWYRFRLRNGKRTAS
jgi:hypothetical protein